MKIIVVFFKDICIGEYACQIMIISIIFIQNREKLFKGIFNIDLFEKGFFLMFTSYYESPGHSAHVDILKKYQRAYFQNKFNNEGMFWF